MAQTDRLGHMWVLGKTGVGKSTFLLNLIHADLQAGRGLMVLDPHGDLVEDILALVPAEPLRDTVYFNPADTAYPVAFNLWRSDSPKLASLALEVLVSGS